MTSRQINVNLGFTADTSQAKANIEALKTSLNQLASITPFSGGQLTSGLQSAVSSAKELQRHLSNAFNVKTRNLDLSKLDLSLKSANASLSTLGSNLLKAGSTGQQAFMNLQNAIASSNVQVKTANGLLAHFGTTMMNTIKWQLSSSLIHGFIGGMRKAVNYVEDLNKSLNNIRIVTQYDTGRMADFAKEANKAAKALSASTTAYTDASLIYFQQGLNEKQAKERADVTIKMSNVTRQSVEETSNQMTAIWNNFAKEGDNLERFGDILTALGAKTASSTAEIAGGIEKFAGLANTIGLSYEYAASALATITAETRQSEDVVGTALKTIFARLQGLQLGETLEDGVSLNKYSEALHKVGVEVLDASGEMRSMDNILQDLSVKWKGLSNAQQTALAQTVAGVRQYTQLVTLMDNYDVMESNLNIARTADGTLEEQSEVYEQSIEAARKRLKTSAQEVYSTLFPEDAIYGFTEGLSKAIDLVADLLKGMGGLPGILLMVSNIALTKMRPALAESINQAILKTQQLGISFKNNITNAWTTTKSVFSGQGQQSNYYNQGQGIISSLNLVNGKDNQNFQKQSNIANEGLIGKDSVSMTTQLSNELLRSVTYAGQLPQHFQAYLFNIQKINNVQSLINESAQYLTKADQERLSNLQKQAMMASDVEVKEKQILETMQAQQSVRVKNTSYISSGNIDANSTTGIGGIVNGVLNTETNRNIATGLIERYGKQGAGGFQAASFEESQLGLVGLSQKGNPTDISSSPNRMAELHRINAEIQDDFSKMITLEERIKNIESSITDENEKQKAIMDAINNSSLSDAAKKRAQDKVKSENTSSGMRQEIGRQSEILKTEALLTGSNPEKLADIEEGARGLALQMGKVDTAVLNTKNQMENITKTITDAIARTSSWGGMISGFAQGLSTVSMGINSVVNAFNTLGNEDASFSQKLMVSTMALTMGFRSLMTVINFTGIVMDAWRAKQELASLAQLKNLTISELLTEVSITKALTTDEETSAEVRKALATKGVTDINKQNLIITNLVNAAKAKGAALTAAETDMIVAETTANWANVASEKAKMLAKMGYMAIAIAAIALITAGIVAMVRASQAEERAYKQASQTAKELAERAEETKDKLESVSSAIDEYSKVIDTLESCTKGTEAWNEALEEAHKKVDALLEQYPELLKYANLLNDDGTINKDVLEQFEKDQQEIGTNASMASLMSEYVKQQKKLDKIYEENKTIESNIYKQRALVGDKEYFIDSTGVISDEGGIYNEEVIKYDEEGNYIGHIGMKNAAGSILTKEDAAAIEKQVNFDNILKNQVAYALEKGVSNMAEVAQVFPDVTEEYRETILELIKAEQESINIFDNIKDQTIKDWEKINNIDLTEQQELLITEEYENLWNKTFDSLENKLRNMEYQWDTDTLEELGIEGLKEDSKYADKTALEAYSEITGKEYDWKENADKGGKDGSVRYKDEEGKTKFIKKDNIRQTIAGAIALESLGLEDIEETMGVITEFENKIDSSGILNSFIGGKQGSLGGLTSGQLEDFMNQFNIYFNSMNPEQKDSFATNMGFDNFQDFFNTVTAAKDAAQNSMVINITNEGKTEVNNPENFSGDTASNLENVFNNWLENAKANGYTFDPTGDFQNAIAESLEQAFSLGGDALAKNLTEALLGTNLGALDTEQLEEFMNLLNGFDWSQNGAVESFLNQLGDISPILSGNLDTWTMFAEQAKRLGLNLPIEDMETFVSQMGTLLGLLQDFEVGKVLKPEEFQKFLGAMGEQAYDYVAQDVNGNYVVTKEMSQDDVTKYWTSRFNQQKEVYEGLTKDKKAEDVATEATSYLGMANNTEMTQEDYDKMMDILNPFITYSEDDLLSIFNTSQDEFASILKGDDLSAKQNLLRQYATLLQTGATGGFNEQAYQDMLMRAAQDAATLSQTEGYYNADGTISKEGAKQMARVAAETEGAEDIIDRYNDAIEGVAINSQEWHDANKQLDKDMKQLYSNKTAKNIQDVVKELDKLKGEERNVKLKEIADELNTAFGTETFNSKLVDQNMPLIKRWLNGDATATEKLIEISIVADPETQEYLNTIDDEKTRETHKEIIIDAVSKGADLNQVVEQLNSIPSYLGVDINTAYQNGGMQGLLGELVQAYILAGDVAKATELITGFGCNVEGLEAYIQEVNKLNSINTESAAYQDQLIKVGEAWKNVKFLTSNGNNQSPPPNIPPETDGGNSKTAKESIDENYSKAIDRQKEELQRIRENLNPIDAQKYYEMEIDLLEKENELLEKQFVLKKDILKQAVDDFNAKDLGYKLEIGDDGTISNMADVMAEISLKYDEMAASEGETRAEKEFGALMEQLESILTIEDTIWEIKQTYQENNKRKAELALEKITAAIDWKVQLIDWEIEKLNYYQEKLLSQAHGNKQEIEAMLEGFEYQTQEMQQLIEKSNVLKSGIDQLMSSRAEHGIYGEQMYNEAILDYQQQLLDTSKDIIDLRNEIEELVQNVLDKALDETSTQLGRLDTYASMLGSFANIIDLSGRSIMDAGLKAKISSMNVQTLTEKMKGLRNEMNGLTEATNLAREAYEKSLKMNDEQSVKFWENQLNILEQELESSQSEFLSSWEEVLNAATEMFEAQVETISQVLSNALSPYSSLEVLQASYDQAKTIQEQYLDDSTKLYELNKLNRQLNLAIADENDLLAKQKLRSIQEDILNLQRTGVQMSQYDLDILQARYELRLAEIALMESQNSKTSMRLVRDASGNYSYVYDADEEKIEDATQKYEDALHELDQVSKEYLLEMTDAIIANEQEFTEALMNLDKTAVDYEQQLLDLQEYHLKRQDYLIKELNKSAENSGIAFEDTLYGQMKNIATYEEAYSLFVDNSEKAVDDLIINYQNWKDVVEETMGVAGTSWDSFSQDMDSTLGNLETHIETLCNKIGELITVLMNYLKQSIGMVSNWQELYSQIVEGVLNDNETVFSSKLVSDDYIYAPVEESGLGGSGLFGMFFGNDYTVPVDKEKYAQAYNAENGWCARWVADVREAVGDDVQRAESASKMAKTGQAYKYGGQELAPGTVVLAYDDDGFGHAMIVGLNGKIYGTANTASDLAITQLTDYPHGSLYYIPPSDTEKGRKAGLLAQSIYAQREKEAKRAQQFDTGGYTGNWGSSEGRLAVLHEKEIILNKQDTPNLLQAIQLLRNMNLSNIIDKQVAEMLNQTNFNLANLASQVSLKDYSYPDSIIEQTVQINAEFPNATNQYEIQEALENLSNNASQYLGLNK